MINTSVIVNSKSRPSHGFMARPAIPPQRTASKKTPFKRAAAFFVLIVSLCIGLFCWLAVSPDSYNHWASGSYKLLHWFSSTLFAISGIVFFMLMKYQRRMYLLTLFYIILTGFFLVRYAGNSMNWGQDLVSYTLPSWITMLDVRQHVLSFIQKNMVAIDLNAVFHSLHDASLDLWYVRFFGMILPVVFVGNIVDESSKMRLYLSPFGFMFCFLIPDIIVLAASPIEMMLQHQTASPLIAKMFMRDVDMWRQALWSLCMCAASVSIFRAWTRFAVSADAKSH